MNIFHAEETSLIIAQNENVHVRRTFYSFLSRTAYSMVGVPVKQVSNTQLSVCTNSWLQVFRLLDQDDLMESRTHFTYTQCPLHCWASRGAANQRKTALKEEIKSFIPSFSPLNGKKQRSTAKHLFFPLQNLFSVFFCSHTGNKKCLTYETLPNACLQWDIFTH